MRTTSTTATKAVTTRFRRRIGRAPLALLALLALTLAVPVREASAQGPPTVTTLDATDVHANYAVLNGTLNPNGGSYIALQFQWGTSIDYDHYGNIAGPMGGYTDDPYSFKITTSDGFFPGATVHFRVMAYDSLGRAYYGSDRSFSVPASPQPVTLPATAITTTRATLNGTANPDGWPTTAWFQWGATTSYGNLTSVTNLGSGTTALPLSAPLAGLTPSVTYHFRVAATNQDGLLYGSDQSFTTLGLPQISTLPATGVSTNTATLNGMVNPNGWPTTAWFQWGATANYGSLTSVTALGSGTTASPLSAALAGLTPGVTYHFRVAATNDYGLVYSSDQTFTALGLPEVSTLPATGVSTNSATLKGTVNPDGRATAAWFQWGAARNYDNLTSVTALGSGTSALPLSVPLAGLAPGVTYHFRVAATNDYGLVFGSDQSFTTRSLPVPFTDADWVTLGSGVDNAVLALAVSGTNLYAGGNFSTAGGVPANHIARWDGHAWSALGSGMNESVYALAVSGTNLYAGGEFTTAGGVPANYIAKWDGSAWSAVGLGVRGWPNSIGWVNVLAASGTDLYAGGSFPAAGWVPANCIAKWDGRVWSALGSGSSGPPTGPRVDVNALAVSGTNLYAGGWFTTAGGVPATNVAKWDGSAWSALGSGIMGSLPYPYTDPAVQTLAVSGTDLYAGGAFTTAGGVPANCIAKWDGSAWSALGSGLNYVVSALAVSGTDLYAGGGFTTTGGVSANRIAKWDGSAWSALGSGVNDGVVYALAADGAGHLFVGGYFTLAGTHACALIAQANLGIAPTVLASPQTQTAEAGATVIVTVDAAGDPPLVYQWCCNSRYLLSCTSSKLVLTNILFSQSGTYAAVVTNVHGAVTSAPALVNVIAAVERRPVPGVKVTGQTGGLANVDYANSLSPAPNWTPLGSVTLTSTSGYCIDPTLPLPAQRFYRAWQTTSLSQPSTLDLHMIPAIILTGTAGSSVRVDCINQFGPIDAWVTLATVTLTNTSQLYFDVSARGQQERLYRLVQVPESSTAEVIMKNPIPLTVITLLLAASSVSAATHYVSPVSTNPKAPYTNWVTAATTIQDAVDAAMAGDEIVVTNGVYTTGGYAVGTNSLVNRVAVTKPVAIMSMNGPQFTTIVGQQVPGTTNGTGAVRCVYLTNGASLSGFTLKRGATLTNGSSYLDLSGGGVCCDSTMAVISNCVVSYNSAYNNGGGAFGGTLNHCTLTRNWTPWFGGAAYSSTLNKCTLSGNWADSGGGVKYGLLNNCVLVGNTAGGMDGFGGGARAATLNNCTIAGNSAWAGGGASGEGEAGCWLNNCIICYNTARCGSCGNDIDYCCSLSCCWTNEPGFVAYPSDLHLAPNSPCVNAGCNVYVRTTTDLDGNPRIMDGTVDIGAYEFQRGVAMQDQFFYVTNGNAITLTGCTYTDPEGGVNVPETINGLPVTSIGDSAFANWPILSSVTIGNSVTNIGDSAFDHCTGLANVTMGNSVKRIGDSAFNNCTNLTNATIPNSVTSIGEEAFASCAGLTSLTIPNRITSIEYGAFEGCGLVSLTIPNSVTSIGEEAFAFCAGLTSLTIPNSVIRIQDRAFEACGLTSVTVPSGVTSIGYGVFCLCTHLTSVNIGDRVSSIGDIAFADCYSLTNITIPSGVTNLGEGCLASCYDLRGVYFQGNAPGLGGGSVFASDNYATVYYLPGTTGWGATFGGRPTAVWPPPRILTAPPTQTAEAGSGVGWGVKANSPLPLFYCWYLNSTNLLICSTNCALDLSNVQSSQSGAYTVVVSNLLGAVTSPPAMLNVIAPVERRPVPGIKLMGEAGSLLSVEYADSFSPALNWTPLGAISLTSTSAYCFDPTLPLPAQRFYRAWQTTDPLVLSVLDLRMVPALTLTGPVDSSVRVDYINRFGRIDAWVTLATVTLTNTSQLYFDVSALGQPARLYRIVPVP